MAGRKKLRDVLSYIRDAISASLILLFNFVFPASSEILNQLSKQDKEQLNHLFNYFVNKSTFPYTLFGNKPVSWISISLPRFPEFTSSKKVIHRSMNIIPLWNLWQIWKKHEKLFPVKEYLFIEESAPQQKDIFIINKKHFISIVNQHQDVFESILQYKLSGETLLQEMEKQSSFRKVIQNSDLLLGILLGFGKHNACLYQQREDLEKLYKQYKSLLNNDSLAFQDLENKSDKITGLLKPFGEANHPCWIISPIFFMADPKHLETITLKSNYEGLQHEISKLYYSGNILEISINQLLQTN